MSDPFPENGLSHPRNRLRQIEHLDLELDSVLDGLQAQ